MYMHTCTNGEGEGGRVARERQVSTTTAGPQSRGMIFRCSCRPGGRYEFPVPPRDRISTSPRAGRYAASWRHRELASITRLARTPENHPTALWPGCSCTGLPEMHPCACIRAPMGKERGEGGRGGCNSHHISPMFDLSSVAHPRPRLAWGVCGRGLGYYRECIAML
jgi:hypothetical protein